MKNGLPCPVARKALSNRTPNGRKMSQNRLSVERERERVNADGQPGTDVASLLVGTISCTTTFITLQNYTQSPTKPNKNKKNATQTTNIKGKQKENNKYNKYKLSSAQQ